MATGTAKGPAPANGRAGSARDNPSHANENQVPAPDSPPSGQRPTKKPRLKLNVRSPKPDENPSHTIAVSRPKRNVKPRYSQDVFMSDDEEEAEPAKPAKRAPAARSSRSSSLSSAPPSPPREESPFKDPSPPPTGNEDYGDFMSYYIAPGDDDALQEQPKSKAKSRSKAKPRTSKVEPAKPSKDPKHPAPPPKAATESTPIAPPPAQHQARNQSHSQQRPPVNQLPPQHPDPPPRLHQNVPPPYPSGPPQAMHRPGPQMVQQPMPQPLPQPVIQFIDVAHDLKPTKADTVAEMIKKLQDTSAALTRFGGVPAVPTTPPPQPDKKPVPVINNPLDGFLSLFGGEDDDDSEDKSEGKPEEKDLDYVQSRPGTLDAPLSYGIQFIQNALKSWAQQRMTHQITQQLQAQHQQMLHDQHMNPQRRGPGRPRKFDDPLPGQPGGPPPVIQMSLADTPEGLAIKSFQSILDSGCLQVNTLLPEELTRALRHLYMQIDHLINQGVKSNDNWQCMSYGAQIAAHRVRVEKWKEAQARAHEEMARQQEMNRLQIMAQMGIDPNTPMTEAQLQHAHALDLERKRSVQHAAQQPYNSQQHLNPLQLGTQAPRGSGTPSGLGPSPPPALSGEDPSSTTGSVLPSNDRTTSSTPIEQQPDGTHPASAQVQLDKMKLYMPGFLPRSGQAMKFSFAPNNEDAKRVFGPESFPRDQPQGSQLPNRGPMSAVPAASNGIVQPLTDTPMPDAQPTMIDLTSDEPESQQSPHHSPRPKTSNGITGGFTAVNKPAPAPAVERPASVPVRSPMEESPGTIRVSRKHSSRVPSTASSSKIDGAFKKADMASKFPHPGAIVLDD